MMAAQYDPNILAEMARRLSDLQRQMLQALKDKGPGLVLEVAVRVLKFPEDVVGPLRDLQSMNLVSTQAVRGQFGGELFSLTALGEQVLRLLNDPIFVEASRAFAARALKEGGALLRTQIAWAFERATGRKPNTEEAGVLSKLYQNSLLNFQRDAAGARKLTTIGDAPTPKELNSARLAAMTTVTRAILNLHETITRN